VPTQINGSLDKQ